MMDALTLLRDQAGMADDFMTRVVRDLTPAQAVWQLDGAAANRIESTYLHVYYSEDRTIQERTQGKPLLFDAGGWQARIGVDPSAVWTTTARADLLALRAYAAAVHAATQDCLTGM